MEQNRQGFDAQLTQDLAPHREALHRFAVKLSGNEALAEDITQDTYLRAGKTTSSYRGEASPFSWLCAIALNLLRDHYRARARRPETDDAGCANEIPAMVETDAETLFMQREMSDCIAAYLTQLPRPQYDVVALHDMAGLSHGEIAAALDISDANSRVLLHRGRKALQNILRENCVLSFDSAIPCEPRPERK